MKSLKIAEDNVPLADFVGAVQEGLADSTAGRLVDDEDLDSELDNEIGSVQLSTPSGS
jgi:predicted transcriptional regulator